MVKDKELETNLKIILDYVKALNNPQRRKILELCKNKPKTISELKRILKSSNKVTHENVKILEKASLVKLEKKIKEKHHPVYVKSYMTSLEALMSIDALIQVTIKDK